MKYLIILLILFVPFAVQQHTEAAEVDLRGELAGDIEITRPNTGETKTVHFLGGNAQSPGWNTLKLSGEETTTYSVSGVWSFFQLGTGSGEPYDLVSYYARGYTEGWWYITSHLSASDVQCGNGQVTGVMIITPQDVAATFTSLWDMLGNQGVVDDVLTFFSGYWHKPCDYCWIPTEVPTRVHGHFHKITLAGNYAYTDYGGKLDPLDLTDKSLYTISQTSPTFEVNARILDEKYHTTKNAVKLDDICFAIGDEGEPYLANCLSFTLNIKPSVSYSNTDLKVALDWYRQRMFNYDCSVPDRQDSGVNVTGDNRITDSDTLYGFHYYYIGTHSQIHDKLQGLKGQYIITIDGLVEWEESHTEGYIVLDPQIRRYFNLTHDLKVLPIPDIAAPPTFTILLIENSNKTSHRLNAFSFKGDGSSEFTPLEIASNDNPTIISNNFYSQYGVQFASNNPFNVALTIVKLQYRWTFPSLTQVDLIMSADQACDCEFTISDKLTFPLSFSDKDDERTHTFDVTKDRPFNSDISWICNGYPNTIPSPPNMTRDNLVADQLAQWGSNYSTGSGYPSGGNNPDNRPWYKKLFGIFEGFFSNVWTFLKYGFYVVIAVLAIIALIYVIRYLKCCGSICASVFGIFKKALPAQKKKKKNNEDTPPNPKKYQELSTKEQ